MKIIAVILIILVGSSIAWATRVETERKNKLKPFYPKPSRDRSMKQ